MLLTFIPRLLRRILRLPFELVGASVPAFLSETSPTLLDHRFYPRILDLIILQATPETLAIFCRVSKGTRRLALIQFRHLHGLTICVELNKKRIGCIGFWTEGSGGNGVADSGSTTKLLHLHFRGSLNGGPINMAMHAADLLPNVSAIDVQCCGAWTDLRLLALPSLSVLRFNASPLSNFHVPHSVQTVILTGPLDFAFMHNTSVPRLVINLPRPRSNPRWSVPAAHLKELVIICQGDQRDYIMTVWPLIWTATTFGIAVTLVGSSPSTECWNQLKAPYDMTHAGMSRWMDAGTLRVTQKTHHRSEEEYRAEIGEEQWELESNVPKEERCRCFRLKAAMLQLQLAAQGA